VTLLFGLGADVNIRNKNNRTALDLALDNGRLDVARYLSELMGNADSLDRINLASFERESHNSPPDVARASLECGNSPNIPDETTSLRAASEMGDLVLMQSLLETGADVNERDETHATPLVYVSKEGRFEAAKLLIEYGADVNLPGWTGWTPLHAASSGGYADVVHLLLDHGADLDAKNQRQWTALHLALNRESFETIKALVEQGANVHVQNDLDQTAFQIVSRRGDRRLMRLFSEYGAHGSTDVNNEQ
jgi:ankyrin repeat protein